MSTRTAAAGAAICACMAVSFMLPATDSWSMERKPDEGVVQRQITLGSEPDGLALAPMRLGLEVGHYHRLVVTNPSDTTHFFWAPEFGGYATWTDRVEVDRGEVRLRPAGAPGETYSTWEIEIAPGGTALWDFVPEMAGRYSYGCSAPAHEDAGMKGTFIVVPGPTPYVEGAMEAPRSQPNS